MSKKQKNLEQTQNMETGEEARLIAKFLSRMATADDPIFKLGYVVGMTRLKDLTGNTQEKTSSVEKKKPKKKES